MSAALLGVRLALTPASRVRTVLGAAATALGSLAMFVVAAIARGELAVEHATISGTELGRLVLAVVIAVALPLVALIATVARLSASIRDRRLANLRLIGLTPTQTRIVATAEAAVASVAGLVVGLAGYLIATGILGPLQRARISDIAMVCLAVPGISIMLSVLPVGTKASSALARARRADRRPPSPLRAVPLLVGIALCTYTIIRQDRPTYAEADIVVLFAGIILTGIGLLLVVPVFVRLLAGLIARIWDGPTVTVTSRRLQAQPAGIARVVSALLIGLFVVTGARYVVVAFESVPQYRAPEHSITVEQRSVIETRLRAAPRTAAAVRGLDGVREVLEVPRLRAACAGCGVTALVMTCTDLVRLAPKATGCRDDDATWLWDNGEFLTTEFGLGDQIAWHPGPPRRTDAVMTTSGALPSLDPYPGGESIGDILPTWGDVIIPPRLATDLPATTPTTVLVLGDPGRDLGTRLFGLGYDAYDPAGFDFEFYDMVRGLRLLAAAVAAFVLAVGLLAFAVAAIDRAIVRRRELVGLRLLGVPSSLLRRSQWLEALLPIGVGSVLAVGLGALAGATYISLAGDVLSIPWASTVTIAAAAAVGAVLVAGLTVIAGDRPIDAEMIRTE